MSAPVTTTEKKKPLKPKWWLNTYFLFGILLVVVSILGLIRGAEYIRDPGQPENSALAWWYLFAAALFFINGYVSHQATVKAFSEETNA